MEVLILTVFASLVLAVAALVFFAWNMHQHSHEHIDRLALLPLADEAERPQQPTEKD
jgi:cbb3-type cytochrome oxidase maturation protein